MPAPGAPADPLPPLGSWPRTYVAVAALLLMALLWWLTAHFDKPIGSGR